MEIRENQSSQEKNQIQHESQNKSTKSDLIVNCLLCDWQFKIKYIIPKKRYSLKNNWGYWTQKVSNQHKYLCDSCLLKLHIGRVSDWIKNETRADVFYNYVKKGQFGQKIF